ncbi:putative protein disulfide-isomerase [Porphyridium purpureum]|uniref:Thioredoxin domain-containing protein n=1 Tax=Porphyridium purpureum TaxID=35688 RepID=A0A5J4Z7K9_PORPP|nr:putative protein disulfide-isomerase [Porphyridium purpureum]|eukprot:POR9840..scf295_1
MWSQVRRKSAMRVTLLAVACVATSLAIASVSALYDFKKSKVVELTPKNFKKLVVNSNETWMVEFYAPWCGHCKALTPHYNKAASSLDGIAKLGAVDADQYKELGSKYGVRGYPTIKIFKGIGTKARRPSDYSGERSAKAITDYVKGILPSFVAVLKTDGVDSFFRDEAHLPHVILFTQKKQTSAQMKALSAKLLGQVSIGEVRGTVKGGKEVAAKYQVEKFPTLLVFEPGSSEVAVRHDEDLDSKKLASILLEFGGAEAPEVADEVADEKETRKESPSASPKKEKEPKPAAEKTFSQPEAHDTSFHVVADGPTFERECSKRSDGLMCVLFMGSHTSVASDEMMEVLTRFKFDRFAFAHIDTQSTLGKGAEYASTLGVPKGHSGVAIIRPNKQRFAVLDKDTTLSPAALQSFLDRAVGGDLQYRKLPTFPEWPAAEQGCGDSNDSKGDDDGHCEL